MTYRHTPVLVNEVLENIPFNNGISIVDCNLGEGGHSSEIARKIENYQNSQLIGIERDKRIFEKAESNLSRYSSFVRLYNDNFINLENILQQASLYKVDVILFDLGISSFHYVDDYRGFSFMKDEPIDMRLDNSCTYSAQEILNTFEEKKIAEIINRYGEERFARVIAKNIVKQRKIKQIETTIDLVNIVNSSIPRKFWPKRISPATKTFQALRIFINNELENIEKILPIALKLLNKGGRLLVITFHSLEDRIVKRFMQEEAKSCICPPSIPVCRCNKQASLKIITRRAIVPTEEEVEKNPASRSSKLRVCEKII